MVDDEHDNENENEILPSWSHFTLVPVWISYNLCASVQSLYNRLLYYWCPTLCIPIYLFWFIFLFIFYFFADHGKIATNFFVIFFLLLERSVCGLNSSNTVCVHIELMTKCHFETAIYVNHASTKWQQVALNFGNHEHANYNR